MKVILMLLSLLVVILGASLIHQVRERRAVEEMLARASSGVPSKPAIGGEAARDHGRFLAPPASPLRVQSEQETTISKFNSQTSRTAQLIAAIDRLGFKQRNLRLVESEGKISPAVAEVLGLSSQDTNTLNSAIDRARERMDQLEMENATVRFDEAGGWVIQVRPFVEGGPVYDDLLRSFSEVMGPERFAAFSAVGSEDLEHHLNFMGLGARTITLRSDPASENPVVRFMISDEVVYPDGTRKVALAANSSVRDEVVRLFRGPLARLVPTN